MRIAIIGSGISGIAAARTLQRLGIEFVIYERSAAVGGIWALAYPEVRLQNTAAHYHLADFPWPFTPDLHPTGAQIREYLNAAVKHFKLDVRLQHDVTSLREEKNGWTVHACSPNGESTDFFDYVIVAVGHYSQEKPALKLAGQEDFQGQVLTERDIRNLDVLKNKRVAVVGFGKSAIDMASFAAQRGSEVHHVFRAPRWLLPRMILGIHMAKVILARMTTAMLPAWVHPNEFERNLHKEHPQIIAGFWQMITLVTRMQLGMHPFWRDPGALERLRVLEPEHPLTYEMRAASALAPDDYFPFVIRGKIQPHRGNVQGLSRNSLLLDDGREIPCDLVILAIGHKSPGFPFLPEPYRSWMASEADGTQLYRHIVHPRIPHLAFAGFNHGFLHVPGVEIGTLWTSAVIRGELKLPSPDEMERSTEKVQAWKRENSLSEPSRAYGISTRFHQYLDTLLTDLGLDPNRKKHPILEWVSAYAAHDYRDVLEEYERLRKTQKNPRIPAALDT